MSSAASATFSTPAAPEAVSAAVQRVLAENKHRLVEQSPDGSRIAFLTRKTMFTWELAGVLAITPAASGSSVELALDTAPGRPSAMLDGQKNRKAVDKLAEQIQAALA